MSVSDFIQKPKPKTKKRFGQVELEEQFFADVKKALDDDGLTMQDVLLAGLKAYMAERSAKRKK